MGRPTKSREQRGAAPRRKAGSRARRGVGRLQLAQRLHQRLRHVAAAVGAEVAGRVGPDAVRPGALTARRPPSPRAAHPRRPAPSRGPCVPGLDFDAARDVHRVRACTAAIARPRSRGEAAGQHQERAAARARPRAASSRRPRRCRPGRLGQPGVEQDARGAALVAQRVLRPEARAHAHRLEHAPGQVARTPPAARRRGAAARPGRPASAVPRQLVRVARPRTRPRAARTAAARALISARRSRSHARGGCPARTRSPPRPRPRRGGQQPSSTRGDAADLHRHAAQPACGRPRLSAGRRSRDQRLQRRARVGRGIRCSPTRKAS